MSARVAGTLAGRRAVVVGLGVSGEAAARALLAAGADVLAADAAAGGAVAQRAERLAALGAAVRTGAGGADLLDGRDLVVPSPGVPQASPVLAAAAAGGVEVWSEPELAWRLAGGRARLVAVTGTNGKTTTTELLAACLDAPSAGNIGRPLCDLLAADDVPPLAVAELSSFQLRFTGTLAPHVAVLLNVAGDHLDWHGDETAYGDAKARVWARQGHGDWAILGVDDAGVRAVAGRNPPPGRVAGFTLGAPGPGQVGVREGRIVARIGDEADVLPAAELAAPGPHQLANALAATAAALCAGAERERVARALAAFRPGPHRLEHVATVGGVAWVNDSKATNPHAAAAALASYDRVVWIAGGLDKGLDFAPLAPLVAGRARAVVTIGRAGPQIAALARAAGADVVEAGTIAAAVPAAAGLARPGDVVLLSPACASMDQFRDYAERGEAFRAAVAGLRPSPAGGRRRGG